MTLVALIIHHETNFLTNRIINDLYECADVNEIIILDNGSQTERINLKKTDRITLLRSKTNLGYPGGLNYLILNCQDIISRSNYLLLVNPDIFFDCKILYQLSLYLSKHANAAAISPKIISPEGTTIFHPQSVNWRTRQFVNKPSNSLTKSGRYHGAFVILKSYILSECGLFDEDLFLYYDEWDYSTRIIASGYDILYAGDMKIKHISGASLKDQAYMVSYYQMRNMLYFLHKFERRRSMPKATLMPRACQYFLKQIFTLNPYKAFYAALGCIHFLQDRMGPLPISPPNNQ